MGKGVYTRPDTRTPELTHLNRSLKEKEMNLNKLKDILNNDLLPPEGKERLIFQIIAEDEKAIPAIMEILSIERKNKKELIDDMNLHLSKAHVGLTSPKMNKEGFIQDEIVTFYAKHKGVIGHCFINLDTF